MFHEFSYLFICLYSTSFLVNDMVISFVKVNVRRSVKGRTEMDVSISGENGHSSSMMGSLRPPVIRKSKLVVVDLAGSERIDKSGESSFLNDMLYCYICSLLSCMSM
jgi:hypothetical protein